MDYDYVKVEQEMFYQDRIGKVYGCFEVINVEYDWERRKQRWTLKCIHCGMIKESYNGKDYVKGKNKGLCKCQNVKVSSPKIEKKEKKPRPRQRDHELYCRWRSIKDRCYRVKCKDYHNYGARGITMCDEWKDNFIAFVEWAYNSGYEKELTIDRIDNNKGYQPDNCRWVKREMQNKNKRNIKLYYDKTIPDICKTLGINDNSVRDRINNGMKFEEAIDEMISKKEKKEFYQYCNESGVKPSVVINRIKKGYSIEEALRPHTHYGKAGPITINGEIKSLSEWCKIYNITVPAVRYRVKKYNISYKEAITIQKQQGQSIQNKSENTSAPGK